MSVPDIKNLGLVVRKLHITLQITNLQYALSCQALCMLLPRLRRGLRGIVFTLSVCLSVCVCVCLSVCVSGQYFGILFIGYKKRY